MMRTYRMLQLRKAGREAGPEGTERSTPAAVAVRPGEPAMLQRYTRLAGDSERVAQLRHGAEIAGGSHMAAARECWQRKADDSPRTRQSTAPNDTGLPDTLKAGMEALSGISLDHVKVHYNSAKPAQLQAHAYAQGSDIHVAPGQERHLPHEAWHVVQQAQGRVRPTVQLQDGVQVNDDRGLESEADVMGGRALQFGGGGAPVRPLALPVPGAVQGVVRQAKGERTAVLSTRDATRSAAEPIRRGNRRASISATRGASTAKLEITYNAPHQARSTGYRNKIGELKAYVKQQILQDGLGSAQWADTLLQDYDTFLQAKAVEEISVGNCGEFAMVVYAHLVQHTDNQYIYRCKMAGSVPGSQPPAPYDHSFVMTSPTPVAVAPNVSDASGFDQDTTTIADAWDGYQVMTLRQFMAGGNAYRTQLGTDNITVLEANQASGAQVLPDAVLGYIRDWAVDFNQKFAQQMANPLSDSALFAASQASNPTGFNTAGSNIRGVDDKRTLAQQIGNSTPGELDAIIAAASNADLFAYIGTLPAQAGMAFAHALPEPRMFEYVNTLALASAATLLRHLPDTTIARYVDQCWNKGVLQRLALWSGFPYKADILAALPPATAYRLLQLMPASAQTSLLKSMSASARQAIEDEAPLPALLIV